jgi:hypothetical protein
LNDAVSYLRSCPEENDPLEFIFGDLVGDFSEAETMVLCALTYFTSQQRSSTSLTSPRAKSLTPTARCEASMLTPRRRGRRHPLHDAAGAPGWMHLLRERAQHAPSMLSATHAPPRRALSAGVGVVRDLARAPEVSKIFEGRRRARSRAIATRRWRRTPCASVTARSALEDGVGQPHSVPIDRRDRRHGVVD